MSIVLHSARIISDGREQPSGWVQFAHGRVAARGEGDSWRERAAAEGATAGMTVIDARAIAGEGTVLTPGFIDIHGHGGGGASFEGSASDIRTARALHRAHGTTRAVLSLVSGSLEHLNAQLHRIAQVMQTDADILGVHLEGPFLDHGHQGAHDPNALRSPTPEAVETLLAAGAGHIRQITMAPELADAIPAIERFTEAGVVVAVGHTGADFATTQRAAEAGARILTHAFNAMPALHHRAPGPLGAALADPRMTIEVIADGVHVHPELVRMLFAAAPGRVALITDAMAAAGVGDGDYGLGALGVQVRDGVARLVDGGAIAGSTLTQDAALRLCVSTGIPLPAAVDALTRTPAHAIGRADLGTLDPGAPADAVLLDADLAVRAVWSDGTRV